MSVYLVEDDLAVRDSLRVLLECEHLDVRDFGSSEALLACRPPWRIGCLIVDVNLPSMSGLDLLEGLRARGFAGPAIAITGNPDPVVYRRAAEAGAWVLEKPFRDRSLVDIVKDVTGR